MGASLEHLKALGVGEEDLEPFSPIEAEISEEGLAGTQHLITSEVPPYLIESKISPYNDVSMVIPHVWAEFLLPYYGWTPVDLNAGQSFGYLHPEGSRLIMSKGNDILIGQDISMSHYEGYGFQWVPISHGRVDIMQSGVWNIAKIRMGRVKILHHPDPFPAEGYFRYAQNLYPVNERENKLSKWREEIRAAFRIAEKEKDIRNIFMQPASQGYNLENSRDAYLCDQLRQIVGKEKFQRIFETYLNLRLTSHKSVSTEKFREITEKVYGASLDFFFREWKDKKSLPQFKQDKYQSPIK
jgi:hypothetical protein